MLRERSLRVHCRFALAAAVALLVLRPPASWWALVALAAALVLAVVLINSALEGFIDLMHPGLLPEIKVVKDMAAGAVLVMSLAALAVAAALMIDVGLPRIREWIG